MTWSAGNNTPAPGFTLLELLVVLVVAALMLTLTGPNLARLIPGSELKAFARQSAAVLRELRSEALNMAEVRTLGLDHQARRYRAAAPLALPWPEDVEVGLEAGTLPGAPATAEPQLVFYPDGSSNGGQLQLMRAGHPGYRVQVNPFTGRVSIDG
ncbi:GspH/FimT family protein [Marinobacterium weihaiense]|uniref:Prepilin-type N-terminal cleavage/methylation domain-containing protein n=1 Tax=Marinobacterium weihaiense TaxID=2851016 RepID=A0ABS6MD96_9GAMM|nr:GspH/FimT family protein [Marinobacterium weihaiense]MBV0934272.1 prepilin-type N-terminal cleavage/methylation domain-containing protein [Marinobacterium weihaiense]